MDLLNAGDTAVKQFIESCKICGFLSYLLLWKNIKHFKYRQNTNFIQKSKFYSEVEMLARNRNFGQKSKFWSEIETLSELEILVRN